MARDDRGDGGRKRTEARWRPDEERRRRSEPYDAGYYQDERRQSWDSERVRPRDWDRERWEDRDRWNRDRWNRERRREIARPGLWWGESDARYTAEPYERYGRYGGLYGREERDDRPDRDESRYAPYERGGREQERGNDERGYDEWVRPTITGRHAGRGPRGYRRSDDRIRDEVCDRLTDHGWIDARDVEVRVEDGDVALEGSVETREEKRLAEEVAEQVGGVRDVQNRIRVRTRRFGRPGWGRTASGRVREGMEVIDHGGAGIGSVKEIYDHDFLLDRPMKRDVFVPLDRVQTVESDRIQLDVDEDRIDEMGWTTTSERKPEDARR
ncbi:MAG: BON domain-containing protein [Candidatus Eisenbacteria bacterium]